MDMLKHIFPDTVYQNAKYNKRSKKLSWKYTSDNLQEFIHLCTVLYVLYAQKIITMKYSYYGEDYLRKIVSNNSYNILNMNAVTKEQNIVSFKLPDDSLRIYISITPGDDKIKVKPEDGIIPYNNIGDYPEPIFDKTKIYVPNAVYNYEDYKATVTEYNVCNINFTIKIESYHKE